LDQQFKWDDGSEFVYSNWATGSPKNLADYCVQMHSEVVYLGKWIDEPCSKKNLVVCQKNQIWTIARLQEIVQEMRITYVNRLVALEQRGAIPIGFTYVQLSHEKALSEIWPTMVWNDVSTAYAGVFFRVEGGTSAHFGEVQTEAAPRLTSVAREGCGQAMIKTIKGGWSEPVMVSNPFKAHSMTRCASKCRAMRCDLEIWQCASGSVLLSSDK